MDTPNKINLQISYSDLDFDENQVDLQDVTCYISVNTKLCKKSTAADLDNSTTLHINTNERETIQIIF